MSDWIDDWLQGLGDVSIDCMTDSEVVSRLRAAHDAHCPHKAEVERLRKLCGEAFDWIDEQLCWEGQDGEHPENCRECAKKKELCHRLYKAWKTGNVPSAASAGKDAT